MRERKEDNQDEINRELVDRSSSVDSMSLLINP